MAPTAITLAAIAFTILGCNNAGLHTSLDAGGRVDSGADLAVPHCPATPPSLGDRCPAQPVPFDCRYDNMTCSCDSSTRWTCRPSACPSADVAHSGGSCTTPNLACNYGFEDECHCVTPENRWLCCGGVPFCGTPPTPPTEGALCCGPVPVGGPGCTSTCAHGVSQVCSCGSDFHLHCQAQSCGDGGV